MLLAALSAISSTGPTRAVEATAAEKITALIDDLSAEDSAARKAAAEKLAELGAAARPAVLAAAHSDDPEARAQAAAVLLKLPWSNPGDPPAVREILDHYTTYATPAEARPNMPGIQPGEPRLRRIPSESARSDAVDALAKLPNFQGLDALIRLVNEDPSNAVRWTIVRALRTTDDGPRLAKLRKPNAPADDAPLAALYGLSWLAADPVKAEPLLRQAIEAEYRAPSETGGELDFVIKTLAELECADHHYEAAAELFRRELKRDAPLDEQKTPLPLLNLFALHAKLGPLAGFEQDVKQAGEQLEKPALLYAIARVHDRLKQTDLADRERKAAFDAGASLRMGRYYTGKFLAEHGWDAEAEKELKEFLAMPEQPRDGGFDPEACDVNAHFELANIAARREDDFEMAEQKKSAMSILGGGTASDLRKTDGRGHNWPTTEAEVWAEIHWHYLKAAVARKDEAAVEEHLNELIRLSPDDPEIATDVVPALKERRRGAEATAFFAAPYRAMKTKLDADPQNPGLMNGVAWLDARCDEDLDEAMKLATAANAALPNNPALLDTLAEVNFHRGNREKAAELEAQALKLRPDDKFMARQLEKFKEVKK